RADRDDVIAFAKIDAADSACRTSHRANVGLVKFNRHAVVRRNEDLPLAVGADDVEELVAFVDVDGVDAGDADVLVIGERCLFDDAVLGDHRQIDLFAKIADGHYGDEPALLRELDEIDDGFAACRSVAFGNFVDLYLKDLAV